ncbi:MAG: class I SAM-dependent methyltransferase [Ardenticatenales bacterium]|nr:class I SAM-dependent methyltransferase [Ardenticatenales bacterium]
MTKSRHIDAGTGAPTDPPRICDYEGSPYRRAFWEDADRRYEDAAERLALRSLLPPDGGRLVEIGAGFGRLVDEYRGYGEIILVDYARSMLADARQRIGDGATYVCADLYRLPFATGALDAAVQIRVLHHVEAVPEAIREVARVLAPGGSYILEFANKRNLKGIARWILRRQAENPFDHRPYEFVPLNWNFHPSFVEAAIADAGLHVRQRRAVSLFRAPWAKRAVPAAVLARLDHMLGGPLGRCAPAPSQFVRAAQLTGRRSEALWRCPACGHEPLIAEPDGVPCPSCARVWPIEDGIMMFRT